MSLMSSRRFRKTQASYIALADKGACNNDMFLSEHMQEKIKSSLLESEEGKVTQVEGKPMLVEFLNNL